MAVGAQPRKRPEMPPSCMVSLKPLPRFLYFSLSTWRRHLTRSSGVTIVWVIPQERTPPKAQRAKYFWDPNSQLYSSEAPAASFLRGSWGYSWLRENPKAANLETLLTWPRLWAGDATGFGKRAPILEMSIFTSATKNLCQSQKEHFGRRSVREFYFLSKFWKFWEERKMTGFLVLGHLFLSKLAKKTDSMLFWQKKNWLLRYLYLIYIA